MATNSNGGLNMDYYPLRPIESMTLAELQAAIPKGDPGGFTLGTAINTGVDLNTLQTSGIYRQTAGANATLALNYPVENRSGILEVFERIPGSHMVQRYTVTDSLNRSRMIYVRDFTSPSWGGWTAFSSTRIDESAGRAIYKWDDINSREQLTYGDTGWRDIVASHGNGTFVVLKLRRVGYIVELICIGWVPPLNGAGTLAVNIPSGFSSLHTRAFTATDNTGSIIRALTIGSVGTVVVGGNSTSSNINFSVSWFTSDTWPTTLPGIVSGTIPNL